MARKRERYKAVTSFVHMGEVLLYFSVGLSLVQPFVSVFQEKQDATIQVLPRWVALFLTLSFGCLIWAFVSSDFSVFSVVMNSAKTTPLIYKISASWSHHEGSMLLWILIMGLYQLALAQSPLPLPVKKIALTVQSLMIAAFGFFVILTSNPFRRLFPIALDGLDLNPLLQDMSVAFHPPLLYAGTVGFSVVFSLTIGILLTRPRPFQEWARWLSPWVTIATGFLTAGITLGSFWAYYELGWGGWWFWDPVENASLMPWLIGVACLHALRVVSTSGEGQRWALFLSLLAFSLSLLGTLMVRSGLLTSVHSFATDPDRGMFLLVIILAIVVSGFSLFSCALRDFDSPSRPNPLSPQGGLLLQTLLVTLATAVLVFGTFYPLLARQVMNVRLTVGAPYFQATVLPILLPALILMGILPFLSKKENGLETLKRRVLPASVIAGGALVGWYTLGGEQFFSTLCCIFGVVLGAWLLVLTLSQMLQTRGMGLCGTPLKLRHWGMLIAHGGIALFILAAAVERGWSVEWVTSLKPGEERSVPSDILAHAHLSLVSVHRYAGANYVGERATLVLSLGSTRAPLTLQPEKRTYFPAHKAVSEAALAIRPFDSYYATLGETYHNGSWTVRLAYHPMVIWIWLGALISALGLFLSLLPQIMTWSTPLKRDRLQVNKGG